MVNSEITQIITENLFPYLTVDGINVYFSNGLTRYITDLQGYHLEISYDFIDNLYRIRIEERKNNRAEHIFLLSRSKKYQKDLAKALRAGNLSNKEFKHHVLCLCKIMRNQLDDYGNLDKLKITYVADLQYDGIFL